MNLHSIMNILLFGVITLLIPAISLASPTTRASKPNFIFIIVDDMDNGYLNSTSVMPNLVSNIIEQGITFTSAYVTSPKCCPSRTSLFSGRMPHNIGDIEHGWCGNFTANRENNWLTSLNQNNDYTIMQVGKWYNQEGTFCVPGYVPAWKNGTSLPSQLSSFYGLCDEVCYYNYSMNINGKIEYYGDQPTDYMTSVFGNYTINWLDNMLTNHVDMPFLMYVAPHAPHLPALPAPWYMDAPVPMNNNQHIAPRTPIFNTGWEDKSFFINNGIDKPMSKALINGSDTLWAHRLRTLMSVDDMIHDIFDLLTEKQALDNTYIIFTSDHGYHLGGYGIWSEKSNPYDSDSNVLLTMRGPGIPVNSISQNLVSMNVDIPATILELSGIPNTWPDNSGQRDGTSLIPLWNTPSTEVTENITYPALLHPPSIYLSSPSTWRDRVLIQYVGWSNLQWLMPCSYGLTDGPCPKNAPAGVVDAISNAYTSLRIINNTHNTLFADYRPYQSPLNTSATNWTEIYDLLTDPYELTNLAVKNRLPRSVIEQMRTELWDYATCFGQTCP